MPQTTLGQLSETRRNNFDFLRFFFSTLVIFSHSYLLLRHDDIGADPLWRVTVTKLAFGQLAVAGFFAISGFLITQSWLRSRSLADYVKKRVLRIYPGWIAAILFGIFVAAPILRGQFRLDLGRLATYHAFDQLLLHNCGLGQVLPDMVKGETSTVNGSTWTIPFELMCYGLVLALGMMGLLRQRAVLLLLSLALLAYVTWRTQVLPIQALGPDPVPYFRDLHSMLEFAVYFLGGMLFFLFRDRIPHSPWLFLVSLVLVALTLFHLPLARLFFLILPTFGFYILFYLAFLPVGNLHAWAKHGDFSYGIYLYAFPLQLILVAGQSHGYHLTPPTFFLAAWVPSCAMAVLSWHFVEKPFLKLKPKPRPGLPPAEDSGVPAVSAEPISMSGS